jgi:hypothetical protein
MPKLDPKLAAAVMRKAKLEPLEEYPGATIKWKCRCLQCKKVVHPKYNMIQRGQGGCRDCGYLKSGKKLRAAHAEGKFSKVRIRRTEADAVKDLKKIGRVPLEPYENTSSPWLSKCIKCGTVGRPPLSALLSKGNSCRKCGRERTNDSKKMSQEEVKEVFKIAGVQLLEPYPYSSTLPLKCKCLRCKRIVYPSYSNARKHKEGCKYCAGTYVDPEDAKNLMIRLGYKPLLKYPGTDTPWKVRHIVCGTIGFPTYGTIKRGGGGCRNCAEWGFSLNRPSYIYLISHSDFGAYKVGVANEAKQQKSDRVHKFTNHGWKLIKRWDFPDGELVQIIEALVFTEIRVNRGIPQFLKKGTMKYEGETETMDSSLIDQKTLIKIVQLKIKEANNISR